MRKWRCTICNYIHEGDAPPERCPICKAPASKFVEITSEDSATAAAAPKGVIKPGPAPAREASQPAPAKPAKSPSPGPEPRPAAPANGLDAIKDLMVKHHAHPVSVHFPNGVLPVAVVMYVLSFLFGSSALSLAGFYNTVFVVLVLPFVLFAGYVEWEKKYNKAMTTLFQVKIVAASITAATALISLVWYLIDGSVLSSSLGWLFVLLNLVMLGCAGVAGFLGGKLVFKD
ncbi:MAG: DUF2231 domain-containing protein [Pseudomonadota bacterium]